MGSWRPLAALGLCALVAACDQAPYVITRVDRTEALDQGRVRLLAAGGGLPTEIHGAPWRGATPETLAGALRMPNRLPPNLRFRAVAPGTLPQRAQTRLVLIFNGSNPPDASFSCDLGADEPTETPSSDHFSAFAVFCTRNGWIGHGLVEAQIAGPEDWDGYTQAMRALFDRILRDFGADDR